MALDVPKIVIRYGECVGEWESQWRAFVTRADEPALHAVIPSGPGMNARGSSETLVMQISWRI